MTISLSIHIANIGYAYQELEVEMMFLPVQIIEAAGATLTTLIL